MLPRPHPNASDIALATAFVDGPFAEKCDPDWLAPRRDELIHQASMLAMIERQEAERIASRQALVPVRRGIAA